ncbi:MAG: bacillithiol biosynthesis cysteine-adding enzyme BshC [Spirochaetes bacterium]|nr:bacillithiol biosynthesis cysteine-adding enzyme BshC [Spirochaetota bacterium]
MTGTSVVPLGQYSPFDSKWRDAVIRRSFFARDFQSDDSFADTAAAVASRNYPRREIADALIHYNQSIGASEKALQSIRQFADGAFVVVTGQQAGMFGGPLYTVYKIITAIQLAAQVSGMLHAPVVPVFWNASNDADLGEINHAYAFTQAGMLKKYSADLGSARMADGISYEAARSCIDAYLNDRHDNDFKSELADLLSPAGNGYSAHVSRIIARLFADDGLIVLEPHLLYRHAAGVYTNAVMRSDDIAAALAAGSHALRQSGFSTPVSDDACVHLFAQSDGVRHRVSGGNSAWHAHDRGFSTAELGAYIAAHPETFGPDVVSRVMMQQAVLPTLAYVAGPSEYNYLAQLEPLFRIFDVPVPVIYPRVSATLVEQKYTQVMKESGMSAADLFGDYARFEPDAGDAVVTAYVAAFTAAADSFQCDMEKYFGAGDDAVLKNIRQFVSRVKSDADRIEDHAQKASARRKGIVVGRLSRLREYISPRDGLQERTLNILEFVHRHGAGIVPEIRNAVSIGMFDHQVVFVR